MELDIAKGKCYQADLFLVQAQRVSEQSQRRDLILKACDLYQDVLNQAHLNLPEPYIGLAYLIFSSGDRENAVKLLKTAVELSTPEDSRASLILYQILKAPLPQSNIEAEEISSIRSLRSKSAPTKTHVSEFAPNALQLPDI